MRKVLLFLAVATVALSARAQSIKLIAPTAIDIPVSGTTRELRVYYQAPPETDVTITDVGTLISGQQVKATVANPATQPPSVLVSVTLAAPFRPGESHAGALVFTPKAGDAVAFPVTISRGAPAFTATVEHTDICLSCGEPRVVPVKITNTGTVVLEKITVGTVIMADSARQHRVVLPRGDRDCAKPPTTTTADGQIVASPGSSVTLALAPGDSRRISVELEAPPRAGDYATTLELSTDGAASLAPSLVVRTRGPHGGTLLPFGLFLLTLLLGTAAAFFLEWWFGAGGGDLRAKALISLADTNRALQGLHTTVVNDGALRNTVASLLNDLTSIALARSQAGRKTTQQLTDDAATFELWLVKRERLWQKVDYARKAGKQQWIPLLDQVQDIAGETDAQYDARLDAVLNTPIPIGIAPPPPPAPTAADIAAAAAAEAERRERLARQRRVFKRIRDLILIVLVFGTAWGMFYGKGCNFGSWPDYFGLVVWTLGLTGAGAALVNQVQRRT